MTGLDPRLNAYRPDLAASSLRGKVEATRFADGVEYEIIHGQAPVRNAPRHDAEQISEALYGERITTYEFDDEGWAWGQLAADRYVGYLPAAALLRAGAKPTHKISAIRTHGFPGPDIKLPPAVALPFGARVAVVREQRGFAVTAHGLHLFPSHLATLDAKDADFVAVAERFIGAPYLWGGKTALGIDCSGLVQVSLLAAGVACPRDTDMQEAALGRPSDGAMRRGDLLFWKGHVAVGCDEKNIIHANAFHMAVVVEPAQTAIARIKASGGALTSTRRL